MTAKEKANELYNKMCQTISSNCEHEVYCDRKECQWQGIILCIIAKNEAKQCSLIAVDEMINEHCYDGRLESKAYWIEVKKEITNL